MRSTVLASTMAFLSFLGPCAKELPSGDPSTEQSTIWQDKFHVLRGSTFPSLRGFENDVPDLYALPSLAWEFLEDQAVERVSLRFTQLHFFSKKEQLERTLASLKVRNEEQGLLKATYKPTPPTLNREFQGMVGAAPRGYFGAIGLTIESSNYEPSITIQLPDQDFITLDETITFLFAPENPSNLPASLSSMKRLTLKFNRALITDRAKQYRKCLERSENGKDCSFLSRDRKIWAGHFSAN